MLTIEQLKNMQVDDWVWISTPANNGGYYQKVDLSSNISFAAVSLHYGFYRPYSTYGIEWFAYNTKQEAGLVERIKD